jgi:AraC-like DNA-binding protein
LESYPTEQYRPTPAQFRLKLSVSPGNAHEFDLWRFGMSPMFSIDARDPDARSAFEVDFTSYQFGDLAISRGSSSAATFERTAQTIARSGLDNIGVVTYLAGGCNLDADERLTEVHPGDVCILDMTRRTIVRGPDYESLAVVLPRALLEPLLPNLDDLHGLILKKETPLAIMLVDHLRSLFREAPSLGLGDARAAARGTAALIAAFAGALANGRDTSAQAAAAASLQPLRRTIEANLANRDLGPEFLSRHAGVSRATLYRLFEPIGGVRAYIQQRRLTRAYQMITDPAHARLRVGTIAAHCGFSNDSVFSRAFREAYGVSPSDLRNASGRRDASDLGLFQDSGFTTMNRWLIGMDAAGR